MQFDEYDASASTAFVVLFLANDDIPLFVKNGVNLLLEPDALALFIRLSLIFLFAELTGDVFDIKASSSRNIQVVFAGLSIISDPSVTIGVVIGVPSVLMLKHPDGIKSAIFFCNIDCLQSPGMQSYVLRNNS